MRSNSEIGLAATHQKYERDDEDQGDARIDPELNLGVIESLVTFARQRSRPDQQDVSHPRDDADNEKWAQLETATLQMGDDRAEQFENDDDEQHTVHGGGDPVGEHRAGSQRVRDCAVQENTGDGDQHYGDRQVDHVLGKDQCADEPVAAERGRALHYLAFEIDSAFAPATNRAMRPER